MLCHINARLPIETFRKQSQQVDLFIQWMLKMTGIYVQDEQASDKKDGFNLIFLSSQHVAIS